jgi:glutamate-1-semialdehyde 2,1-aminomutase
MTEDLASDEDREFFARELEAFVPERVFDAHCHLWGPENGGPPQAGFPGEVGCGEVFRLLDVLHPGREASALFIPLPFDRENAVAAGRWVAAEARKDERSRGLWVARPSDDPEWVRSEVRELGLSGIKCYHLLADVDQTWEAELPDYLPERLVEVADEEGWVITLHVVKRRALADPSNLHWIRYYCEKYPGARFILAHAGRSFQPAHNLEGLPRLAGLGNLYFDTSANCEAVAHEAVLRTFGHKRLLYGSDFFVSHLRGRSVAAADSFLWLDGSSPVWSEKHDELRPVLVGLESLRALKWAAWSAGLADAAVEGVFWANAVELFALNG